MISETDGEARAKAIVYELMDSNNTDPKFLELKQLINKLEMKFGGTAYVSYPVREAMVRRFLSGTPLKDIEGFAKQELREELDLTWPARIGRAIPWVTAAFAIWFFFKGSVSEQRTTLLAVGVAALVAIALQLRRRD